MAVVETGPVRSRATGIRFCIEIGPVPAGTRLPVAEAVFAVPRHGKYAHGGTRRTLTCHVSTIVV